MKLWTFQCRFKLLTPCFCGGADNRPPVRDRDNPSQIKEAGSPAEMRVASIRGQVRLWQRLTDAANGESLVNRIWGNTDDTGTASRVGLMLDRHQTALNPQRILPHATSGPKARSERNAIPVGEEFTLTLQRLVGCSKDDWLAAHNAVKLWLLIGGLGLRCNRAAGSVWPIVHSIAQGQCEESQVWSNPPATETELKSAITTLIRGWPGIWPVYLADPTLGSKSHDLRTAASDTLGGRPEYFGEASKRRRLPSPIKFKVIELDGALRLLITAARLDTIREAKKDLASKPLGVTWRNLADGTTL